MQKLYSGVGMAVYMLINLQFLDVVCAECCRGQSQIVLRGGIVLAKTVLIF